MPVTTGKRRPIGMAQRVGAGAFGAARAGFRAGKGAFDFSKKAYGTGKHLYGLYGRELEKNSRTHSDRGEEGIISPPSPEEEIASMRERKMERLLGQRMPQHAEELMKLVETAAEQEVEPEKLHQMLAEFFEQRYPNRARHNVVMIKRWIKLILSSAGKEYAKYAKEARSLRIEQ